MRQTSRVLSTKILRSSWTSANKYLLAMPVYHFSFKWNLGRYRHRCIVVAMAVRCSIITRGKEVTFYDIEYLFQRRSSDGFVDWTFSTVRCWGEKPQGTWQLIVIDNGMNQSYILCASSQGSSINYLILFVKPFLFSALLLLFIYKFLFSYISLPTTRL